MSSNSKHLPRDRPVDEAVWVDGKGEINMPQSSAALRAKAEALRLLRHPSAAQRPPFQPAKPVWAKRAFACQHGACLALEVRVDGLWVLVRDAAQAEAFAPAARVLRDEQRREWARNGFG